MRNLLAARIFNRVHSGDHFSETVIIIPEHLPRKNALSKKFQMSDESGVMKAFFLQFNIQIFTDDIDHVANETGDVHRIAYTGVIFRIYDMKCDGCGLILIQLHIKLLPDLADCILSNAKLDRIKGLHLNLERVVKLHSFLIPFNCETDMICQSQINTLV